MPGVRSPRRARGRAARRLTSRSADVGAGRAVAAHDPVARDHQRQRVGRARRAHRPTARGLPTSRGELRVADRAAIADVGQVLEHGPAEAAGEPQVDGQVEAVAPAGEVVVELPRGVIEPRRGRTGSSG